MKVTKSEVAVIVAVLNYAYRAGVPVAVAADLRIIRNRRSMRATRASSMLRRNPEAVESEIRRLRADSRRTRKLIAMFASWQL